MSRFGNNKNLTFVMAMLVMLLMNQTISQQTVAGAGPMSNDIRSAVVNKHNQYRSLTASGQTPGMPNAPNMIELSWDPALEKIGANHMSQCTRRSTRDLPQKYFNSADRAMADYQTTTAIKQLHFYTTDASMTPKQAMVAAVDKFYSGYQNYSWATNKCDRRSRCSDYKQIVWSTTRYVGCAYRQCDSLSLRHEGRVSNAIYVTCYYVRSAWGGRPYRLSNKQLTPCSECPSDMRGCSNQLCSKPQVPPVAMRQVTRGQPLAVCSVATYTRLAKETTTALSVSRMATDEANACTAYIGATPSVDLCASATAPEGCSECLDLTTAAVKAKAAWYGIDQQRLGMKGICSVSVAPTSGSCVENILVSPVAGAMPYDSATALAVGDYAGCKLKCEKDGKCACFVFGDGLCSSFDLAKSCDVGIKTDWAADGGFCAH